MFPTNPEFICRRCINLFSFSSGEMEAGTRLGRLECPKCRFEVAARGSINTFRKFYPRLVAAENELLLHDIELTGYTIGAWSNLGLYWWLKESFSFKCLDCSTVWRVPFDPDTIEIKERPARFHCPKCRYTTAKSKDIREFFMCVNQVHHAACRMTNFQWNIFSPVKQVPPLSKIQFKLHAGAA